MDLRVSRCSQAVGFSCPGGAPGPHRDHGGHRDHRQRTGGGDTGGHLLEKLVIGGFGGVM